MSFRRRGDARMAVHQTAMRARANARVFPVTPVDQVVPRFGARAGVVRNLVGGQAAGLADVLCDLVEDACLLVVREGELAGPVKVLKPSVGLDRKLVEREMIDRMPDRRLEFRPPGPRRLAGPGIDQV